MKNSYSELNNIFSITKKNIYAFAQIIDINEESRLNKIISKWETEIQFNFWVPKKHESTKAKV